MRLTPCRCVIIRIMRGNMPQYCWAIGSRTPGDETVLQGVRGGAHRSLAGWITGWNYGALELRKGFTFDRCKRSYRLGGPAYPAARLSERERERESGREGGRVASVFFFLFSVFNLIPRNSPRVTIDDFRDATLAMKQHLCDAPREEEGGNEFG